MPLVMADNEHYTVELLDWITEASAYDLLVPMPNNSSVRRSIEQLTEQAFTRHWAGYATAKSAYQIKKSKNDSDYQFIQRKGERADDYDFKAFLCTGDRDEVQDLSIHYPQRWHIEEFFNKDQALGGIRLGR